MSEIDKNNLPDVDETASTKKTKKKIDDKEYRIYKKESHKDNRCILNGIDEKRINEFNSKGITVSLKEIKIIGCEVNDNGEIISIPYRWLEVN